MRKPMPQALAADLPEISVQADLEQIDGRLKVLVFDPMVQEIRSAEDPSEAGKSLKKLREVSQEATALGPQVRILLKEALAYLQQRFCVKKLNQVSAALQHDCGHVGKLIINEHLDIFDSVKQRLNNKQFNDCEAQLQDEDLLEKVVSKNPDDNND